MYLERSALEILESRVKIEPHMIWKSFQYHGQTFDLAHLNQFDHVYVQPAQDNKPSRAYRVTVRFGHHCFTEHVQPSDEAALLFVVGKEARTFDQKRYGLSQSLPEIMKTLMDRNISHTDHNSFFTIELMNEAGQTFDYEVYFEVSRDQTTKRLYLTVLSAYARDPARITDRPKARKIRLSVILRNIQENKPIRRQ